MKSMCTALSKALEDVHPNCADPAKAVKRVPQLGFGTKLMDVHAASTDGGEASRGAAAWCCDLPTPQPPQSVPGGGKNFRSIFHRTARIQLDLGQLQARARRGCAGWGGVG